MCQPVPQDTTSDDLISDRGSELYYLRNSSSRSHAPTEESSVAGGASTKKIQTIQGILGKGNNEYISKISSTLN